MSVVVLTTPSGRQQIINAAHMTHWTDAHTIEKGTTFVYLTGDQRITVTESPEEITSRFLGITESIRYTITDEGRVALATS